MWGAQSRFAGHFDIDWSRKLTLPILGKPFDDAVAAGEISMLLEGDLGSLALAYFDNHIPLHPASWNRCWRGCEDPAADLSWRKPPGAATPKIRKWLQRAGSCGQRCRRALADELASLSRDHAFLSLPDMEEPGMGAHVLEGGRAAALSYRRFLRDHGVAGVRVEDPAVFDDVHR